MTPSCSSDNENLTDDDSTKGKQILSINISLEEDEVDTRTSLLRKPTYVTSKWYEDDIVWAYSPSNNWYNKLVPVSQSGDKYGETEIKFQSTGEVRYTNSEFLLIMYSGDKKGNTTNPGTGDSYVSNYISFKRATNDNDMAMIYGNSEYHYSDNGNSFSVKGISAQVKDGTFVEKKINLNGVMPKICFNIPTSKTNNMEQYLEKLDYKIIFDLTATGQTEGGYPNEVKLKFKDNISKEGAFIFEYADTDPIVWGEPLKIKYTKDGDEKGTANTKSSSLWNTDETNDENDSYKGYIYIPFPATNYSQLRVRVRVENNSEETLPNEIEALCKTYTFTKSDISLELKKADTCRVYDLGAIWTLPEQQSASEISTRATNAPIEVKPGDGWVVTENE